MDFEFPWLISQFNVLCQYQKTGTLPHAVLLHGPKGVGKNKLAFIISEKLLCQTKSDSIYFSQNTHPYFYHLKKQEDKKIIPIDQVREVISSLYLKPKEKLFQVLFIENVEDLNTQSANALLKTLEEPVANTVIIMTTNYLSQLLPTLLSRCLKLHCAPPDLKTGIAWLESKLTDCSNREKIEISLRLANNSPLLAKRLLQEGLELRETVFELMKEQLTNKIHPIETAEKLEKFETTEVIHWFYSFALDLIKIKLKIKQTKTCSFLTHIDKTDLLVNLSEFISVETLWSWIFNITNSKKALLRSPYLNKQLLLERILLDEGV